MRNSWWYYLHKSISRDTILTFITGDNYVKAIYLGPLSGGNYLELIISSQLFCRAMVWALIVQGLIIWGAITWEATFFFWGGAQLSRGQLSGGTLIREGAIILRDSCPEGNYPRGQLPVRQSSFPKNMFLFLKEINKTRVIKYDPLPTISWQIYLYPKQFLHFMASCSYEVHIFELWNLVRTLQLVHNL